MGCCEGCARWIIGIISILVIVCAVFCGVWVYKHEQDKDWSKMVKNNVPFVFILVCMCFAIVSGIIGFCLCCCKKKCLYVTYLIIIIIVILIEIAGIALAYTYKNKIIDGIDENWGLDSLAETRKAIEKEFKCCGFKTNETSDCGCQIEGECNSTCYDAITDEIDKNFKYLRICVIVMAAIELVLFISACYLACCYKEEYEIK